jgi:lipopolysaccharide/colanic/teichoic acid biosynthesis glycosyltransferase
MKSTVKRVLDISVSAAGLLILSPVLIVVCFLIWIEDRNTPFYVAPRAGRGNKPFQMYKLRTMRVGADKTGVTSTSASDSRITKTGAIIRRFKLDEIPQLVNVFLGNMSLVGPRPQVLSATAEYTEFEMKLLEVRPGITDYASIVFADEGEILAQHDDPGAAYERIIRPIKSRLGVFYVTNHSFTDDIRLIWLTVRSSVGRPKALASVSELLRSRGAEPELVQAALRSN